jgi:D-glycero-D-manno-heptose 1,7-bisphosphate phosphatase
MTRAVFVDRDGTLIEEENYLGDPDKARLTPGAAGALKALRAAGFEIVVVSNQAGVARGLFGVDAVLAVHRRLDRMLADEGARVSRYYFCPHHPEFTGPCRCRKPASGMLVDAERDLGLELGECWLAGDRLTDVEASQRVGCPGILVRTGYGAEEEGRIGSGEQDRPAAVCDDLVGASGTILGRGTRGR